MKKSEIQSYNNITVKADLDFILYHLEKSKVKTNSSSGLGKLVSEVEHYLDLEDGADVTIDLLKPVLINYTLSDSLKTLWVKKILFDIQLKSMNTGDYAYGIKSPKGEINFKDFEFEIFSASILAENDLDIILPQKTDGNDILYKDLEIQCKHPEVLSRDKMDDFLRKFQTSLKRKQKYGVFGLAVDDFFKFAESAFPFNDEDFYTEYTRRLKEYDDILIQVMDDTLRFCPRVLGIYLLNTQFISTANKGLILQKTSNSVFCLRPNATEVPEEYSRQAYEILIVFNPKPAIKVL